MVENVECRSAQTERESFPKLMRFEDAHVDIDVVRTAELITSLIRKTRIPREVGRRCVKERGIIQARDRIVI